MTLHISIGDNPADAAAQGGFMQRFAADTQRLALIDERGGSISYAELFDRVREIRYQLGEVRRLVLIDAGNDPRAIATYVAAIDGGHAVILTQPSPTHHQRLIEVFDPDVATGAEARQVLNVLEDTYVSIC